jgi:hypothetical protein
MPAGRASAALTSPAMVFDASSSRTRAVSPQFHGLPADSFAAERPPRYIATLRAFEMAAREACAMHPDLHDLIGLQSVDAPMRAFVRTAAESHEPPEIVLRRVKSVLRSYERHHHIEHAELVKRAIVAYYGNVD